jgi:hypothetical protein
MQIFWEIKMMKLITNSFAVDTFLSTIRVTTTIEAHGVEENFNFFFPFDANKKPTCEEMAAMIREAKNASHAQFMSNWFHKNPEELPEKSEAEKVVEIAKKRGRKPKAVTEADTADDSTAPSAPVEPTPAPVEPTPAPVEPTPAPVEPTPAPVEPTVSATEQLAAIDSTLLEVEGVIFNRTDKQHANIVGGWFAEGNPNWRNSAGTIALCKEIARTMDGHMFLQVTEDGTAAPIPAVKAKAIDSVKQGRSLF